MTTTNKDAFEYQKPTALSVERITMVREAMKSVRNLLLDVIPASRELSVAMTKLEEVSMWANKAIVFNQIEE